MSKKLSLGAAVALAAVTASVTISLTYVYAMDKFNAKVADINQRQAMYVKLSEIDQKARQAFIGEIDETVLNDGICAGYVGGLGDASARYMSAEKYRDYVSGNTGKNIGVGIRTIQDPDGNMEVVEVFPNSPGEKGGLKKGDVIIALDGKEVLRQTYGEALTKLDGAAGSTVSFTVLRATSDTEGKTSSETLELSVTRAEYQRNSITYSVINGNIGYMALSEFQENTQEQFDAALTALTEQNIAGLVLDLRNNAGGSVEAMAQILDELLPAGNIVNSVDNTGKVTVEFTSKSSQINLPISVVVNGNTYGAAEIFAAGIKDYNKGKLVGEKTAGYGAKDEIIPLSDGSAFILSVAYYTKLNGETFNGTGISVDMEITLDEEQKQLLERGSLPQTEDPQVQAAVTALVGQGAEVQQLPGSSASVGGESSSTDPIVDETSAEEDSGEESSGLQAE